MYCRYVLCDIVLDTPVASSERNRVNDSLSPVIPCKRRARSRSPPDKPCTSVSLTDTQSDPTAVDLSDSSDDSYIGEQKGIHSPDPHRRCLH